MVIFFKSIEIKAVVQTLTIYNGNVFQSHEVHRAPLPVADLGWGPWSPPDAPVK